MPIALLQEPLKLTCMGNLGDYCNRDYPMKSVLSYNINMRLLTEICV